MWRADQDRAGRGGRQTTAAAQRRIAATERSTSSSVVDQLLTETRSAALPSQVVPLSQQVPSAWTASTMCRVLASSPLRGRPGRSGPPRSVQHPRVHLAELRADDRRSRVPIERRRERPGFHAALVVAGHRLESRTTAAPVFGTDAGRLRAHGETLRTRLGAARQAAAVARGAALDDDGLVAHAVAVLDVRRTASRPGARLVERERDLADLAEGLSAHHLVTLTGPGGSARPG